MAQKVERPWPPWPPLSPTPVDIDYKLACTALIIQSAKAFFRLLYIHSKKNKLSCNDAHVQFCIIQTLSV